MAERQLQQILSQLKSQASTLSYADAAPLLSKAKLQLLKLNALSPSPATTTTQSSSPQQPPQSVLALARETYEQGALYSIRARDPEAFTRYVTQLAPFYELPASVLAPSLAERNKVTGLYLLLLLTQGRYAEFHSELESLSTREGGGGSVDVEGDRFLGYPIRLERWLMEGSYDRVWKAMKSREVPSEEFGVFSEILTSQIRSEIASSSERAYPSLPISSTKSLLFLDSEGAVIDFARSRGWILKDGRIYFPKEAEPTAGGDDDDEAAAGSGKEEMSKLVIENALGYARELETIV
ncbi:GANP/Nin1/mts3/eIF-3 p25 family protein [Diaporthe amygdali]|uniref:GANP/Nin1/mts3/eIF-3 p25 family protein n=1 Tax=Phomopsis amygdali TaxID=1214568 RepID=UPI0022FED312|nr:GANP/Nin1/mts3/eIF-3 p25 family protein [Diaporthe amygdali]KAJ0116759.1 GANP/Nin1/mts3/eIF-3 p25 family protein [Diaporthe amygdali]